MFDSTRHSDPRRLLVLTMGAALALPGTTARANARPSRSAEDDGTPLAERVANEDARVRELAGNGPRPAGLCRTGECRNSERKGRDSDDAPAGRYAEVLQYRYDNDSGVLTLVDLEKRAVRDVERVEGSAVPLTREDLEEAVKLALDSGEVQRAARPRSLAIRHSGTRRDRRTRPTPSARCSCIRTPRRIPASAAAACTCSSSSATPT